MRARRAARSADPISRSVILLTGVLCGVLVFFVAVPLALSSPFPTSTQATWLIDRPLSMPVPAVIATPTVIEPEPPPIAWTLAALPPSGPQSQVTLPESPAPAGTGSIGAAPRVETRAPAKRAVNPMQEVDDYLWE